MRLPAGGEATDVVIRMKRPVPVVFKLVDDRGSPAAEVAVAVTPQGDDHRGLNPAIFLIPDGLPFGARSIARTNAAGEVKFESLPPGEAVVQVLDEGWRVSKGQERVMVDARSAAQPVGLVVIRP